MPLPWRRLIRCVCFFSFLIIFLKFYVHVLFLSLWLVAAIAWRSRLKSCLLVGRCNSQAKAIRRTDETRVFAQVGLQSDKNIQNETL